MQRVAVLASGGLDSAVLLADLAREQEVFPLYVRAGLAWEDDEVRALQAFLRALDSPNIRACTVLGVDAAPLYGPHWSISGKDVPGADTPDEAVFLPGRNILLIGLAAVWCSTHGVSRIGMASLAANPFPDATPEFLSAFAGSLSRGLAHEVEVLTPYRGLHKEELIRANSALPLDLTLTCMAPRGGIHCGGCNKCHERQAAFRAAGVPDRTTYARTEAPV